MSALGVLVSFPLVTLLAFSALHVSVRLFPKLSTAFGWISALLYFLLLLLPLSLLTSSGWAYVASTITGQLVLSKLIWLGFAAIIGGGLFLLEGYSRAWIYRHRVPQVGIASAPRVLPPALHLTVILGVVIAEEILWRAYLPHILQLHWHFGYLMALVLAVLSFGLNHYYGGVEQIAFKTCWGFVWAGFFVATGSLLAPVLSHIVFDVLVFAAATESA